MNNIYRFLGLMQKAGKVSSGDDTVEIDMKKRFVKLLIISEDASDNTKKKFKDLADYRNIKYMIIGYKDDLGAAIGKSPRSVLAIKDMGFAKAFTEKASKINNGGDSIVKS